MTSFNKNIARVDEKELAHAMQKHFHNLDEGLDPLMDRIGDARIVLLGEASHGTHEYYAWRARISQRLIREKGFRIIGVEGDWPDCYKINRYIRNYKNSGNTSTDVLKEFHRWPSWMWANWEIAALMEWLKEYNTNRPFDEQAGFYGLDVYSLWESMDAIVDYLEKHHPDAVKAVHNATACFEPYSREGQDYGVSTRLAPETCEAEVLELLRDIRKRMPLYDTDPEAPFNTEQNAVTVVNAEKYYRAMVSGGPKSWNIRDEHMTDTLERLLNFHGPDSKAIVWEHNTHIGDARATNMHRGGMVNTGQLARQRWGNSSTVLVGFGSHRGSVIAGRSWGAAMQEMEVPQAIAGSWEAMLNRLRPIDKIIITDEIKNNPLMEKHIKHRAIGVVYDPSMESYGNYVPSLIPERYDAFVYIDETRALHPLKVMEEPGLTPETYPFGI